MMEFLAANFNLSTIIVAVIVFGGVGWITWHSQKQNGCGEKKENDIINLLKNSGRPEILSLLMI